MERVKCVEGGSQVKEEAMAAHSIGGGRDGDGLHVVVIPFPFHGHIIPMMHLSRELSSRGLFVTFILPLRHLFSSSELASSPSPSSIDLVGVPDGFPLERGQDFTIQEVMEANINMHPEVTRLLLANGDLVNGGLVDGDLDDQDEAGNICPVATSRKTKTVVTTTKKKKVSCVIADLFVPWAQQLADQLHVPRATFWASNALNFSISRDAHFFAFTPPDESKHGGVIMNDDEASHAHLSTLIPGLPSSIRYKDLPFCFIEKILGELTIPEVFLTDQFKGLGKTSFLLLNSFSELEPNMMDVLQNKDYSVYSIGPLLQMPEHDDPNWTSCSVVKEDPYCLEWLNMHPKRSVIYVSLGSMARLTVDQFKELEAGLEASRQPYLWVLPDPLCGSAGTLRHEQDLLPHDFLSRLETKRKGRLLVSWAPQEKVLSHASVGVFLSHCGWNSIIESIWHAMPILGFPQAADQNPNSRMVSHEWKIGMCMKQTRTGIHDRGIIHRDDVQMAAKEVMMKRDELHKRCLEVREAAIKAKLPGGSSNNNLTTFIQSLT